MKPLGWLFLWPIVVAGRLPGLLRDAAFGIDGIKRIARGVVDLPSLGFKQRELEDRLVCLVDQLSEGILYDENGDPIHTHLKERVEAAGCASWKDGGGR
jgi:hypothetical protein